MPTESPTSHPSTPRSRHPRGLRRRLAPGVLALAVAGGSLGLAACGSDDASASGDAPGTTTSSAAPAPAEVDQTIEAVLTSADSKLHEVGPGGNVVYGWNLLTGEGTATGTVHEGATGVEMLGNVDYVDGSGEFFGFITFDFGDGNTLAVRMDGHARAATDTSDAALEADLTVLGGTGTLVDASGVGRFEGGRPERLGGAVQGTYSFDLAD